MCICWRKYVWLRRQTHRARIISCLKRTFDWLNNGGWLSLFYCEIWRPLSAKSKPTLLLGVLFTCGFYTYQPWQILFNLRNSGRQRFIPIDFHYYSWAPLATVIIWNWPSDVIFLNYNKNVHITWAVLGPPSYSSLGYCEAEMGFIEQLQLICIIVLFTLRS
jgi:hypothetical protein